MTKIFSRINAALEARGMAREEGQGVVEYALVLGVLVVAIFVAFNTGNVGGVITGAIGRLQGVLTP